MFLTNQNAEIVACILLVRLFIFKIVKRHRAFRIWRSKNLYIIIIIIKLQEGPI